MATTSVSSSSLSAEFSSLAIVSPLSRKQIGVSAQDLDLLEGGLSKEVTDPKIVRSVASSTSWTKTWVRKTDNVFHMYLEGTDTFIMSALKTSDSSFYISQYDGFHKDSDSAGPNPQNYCAVLKRVGRFGYKLVSTSCENCDDRLGRYSCDPLADILPPARGGSPKVPDRQVLLELTQSVLFLERAGVNARRMTVTLPQVLGDGSRVVWCPRCPRGCAKAGRSSMIVPPAVAAGLSASLGSGGSRRVTLAPGTRPTLKHTASLPTDTDSENKGENSGAPGLPPSKLSKALSSTLPPSAVKATEPSDSITITNRLPKWNDDISSLTMKFLGSRVTASSSKNFLFEMPTPEGTTKHVIQFGKLCPATFSLDFKYPLCPLQAFGLFLSANGWTITKS